MALAVMAVESAGRADAVSSAGAQGLMQLIPATAERFGVADPFDPAQNIAGGIAYLDWLLREFDGDPLLALAGYNAGEGAVRRNGGVPPFAETRDYVPKVLATWMMVRSLCRTPPELVSDGLRLHAHRGELSALDPLRQWRQGPGHARFGDGDKGEIALGHQHPLAGALAPHPGPPHALVIEVRPVFVIAVWTEKRSPHQNRRVKAAAPRSPRSRSAPVPGPLR